MSNELMQYFQEQVKKRNFTFIRAVCYEMEFEDKKAIDRYLDLIQAIVEED